MLFTMGFPGTAHEHGHTHGHSHGVPVAAATTSAATPAGTIEDGGKPSVAESVSEASALAAAGTVKTPVDTLALVAQNVGLIAGVFVMIGIKLFEHARGV
ncbi:hypothetical protein BC828DRAFT_405806 [Blastocladiella britannica]|nr:hypothetical protein BC828DRAFT_405806 [Blastocladiella britannica]